MGTLEEEGSRLCLSQVAEKDQMHCKDTTVELDVYPEEPEVLVMTCVAGDIRAWRRFFKQKPPKYAASRVQTILSRGREKFFSSILRFCNDCSEYFVILNTRI